MAPGRPIYSSGSERRLLGTVEESRSITRDSRPDVDKLTRFSSSKAPNSSMIPTTMRLQMPSSSRGKRQTVIEADRTSRTAWLRRRHGHQDRNICRERHSEITLTVTQKDSLAQHLGSRTSCTRMSQALVTQSETMQPCRVPHDQFLGSAKNAMSLQPQAMICPMPVPHDHPREVRSRTSLYHEGPASESSPFRRRRTDRITL